MSYRNKNEIYDIVFALIEEELHQRRNASGYTDIVLPFDGSNYAVGQTSNCDINMLEKEKRFRKMVDSPMIVDPMIVDPMIVDPMIVGSMMSGSMMGGAKLKQLADKNYIPGKFDAIKYSYHLPLDIALRGTIARQQLFLEEQNKK